MFIKVNYTQFIYLTNSIMLFKFSTFLYHI